MTPLPVEPDGIPEELKSRRRWVAWKLERRRGEQKATKIPYDPHSGKRADTTRPATWADFATALGTYRNETSPYQGIGFVFDQQDSYTGVDLDRCLDLHTGELLPWGRRYVEILNSYTEVSPSGEGVKIWVKGRLPGVRHRKGGFGPNRSGGVEAYDQKRFFTTTGQLMAGCLPTIEERQEALELLYSDVFRTDSVAHLTGVGAEAPRIVQLSDSELLQRASAGPRGTEFLRLWHGDAARFSGDESRADLALVSHLCFWSGGDPEQVDRLFRASDRMRPKWERPDYRERTIAKAMSTTKKNFVPKGSAAADRGSPPREGNRSYLRSPRTSAPTRQQPAYTVNGEQIAAKPSAKWQEPRVALNANSGDLAELSASAWEALRKANRPPTLFRQGGLPVRLETDDTGVPVLIHLNRDRLKHELARRIDWYRLDQRERRGTTEPPMSVVRDMLATPDLPLPVLRRIVAAPAFTPCGILETNPGYNDASQTFYNPATGFVVPAVSNAPSQAEIAQARDLILLELLKDFPFISDAERAHAVSLLLLPFVRALIDGPTPLHLVEKPAPGTGASLLCDMLTYPALGRSIPTMTECGGDDEWRKRITAILRSGASVVLIDNLKQRLDSAAIAAAITCRIWEDRLLGQSETIRVAVECVWVATGNNPALSNEITRRAVRIRLDARCHQPWRRSSFRHPDLRQWAADHRGNLVWAALTLGRAWLAAGKHEQRERLLGMFERWSAVMGGILAVADIPGFLSNLDEFYEETDAESASWSSFLQAWWGQFREGKVGVTHLAEVAASIAPPLDLGNAGERSQHIRLGQQLRLMRDRLFRIEMDGVELQVRLVGSGQLHRAQQWRLICVASAPARPV